ncbi:methyltransferase [Podospora aff. communis PSN243]|uniref:Methyltransferase n=1 Tax=Podospora aff. communis PSN243 TaxID=3040156 RepID=A0AAV9GFR0_9PEZI|nr:methyltransferase [Podospora aff. communis PSN243]
MKFEGIYESRKNLVWFADKPYIPWPALQLLQEYSGYDPAEVTDALIKLRDKAWTTFPWPCIGQFDFLEFSLATQNRLYPRLLARLQSGAKLLDIGCCLGQDIRKLIFDGAPAANLAGAELHQGFIDVGFDLFRDRDKLGSQFHRANVLDDVSVAPWPRLKGKFDIVNSSMVLHAFTWEESVEFFVRSIQMLKPDAMGTTVMGFATGSEAEEVWGIEGRLIPSHNGESFRRLVAEVEEKTGTRWEVRVELDAYLSVYNPRYSYLKPTARRILWEMTRVA